MARKKQRGTCALCLQDRDLRRSHLLGRAIYLLNREGNDEPVLMTPQLITPTQKQIWQHLLCGDCEERFSSHGEALIMRLVQRRTDFALLNRLNDSTPIVTAPNVTTYQRIPGARTG
jgi:hypothetical protein